MKVYEIHVDLDRFQTFYVDDLSFRFDCTPLIPTWKAPEAYILHPKLKAGDFYGFQWFGTLVASPEIRGNIEFYFEVAGEILDIRHEGKTYALLNVLECINVLDQDRSEWALSDEGERIRLTKFAFHEHRFTESSIFKIPEKCRTTIYTYVRENDPDHEFKAFVEENGLTGIEFIEVWDSEK